MLAKKFGFGVGVAIILPLLVHFGVSTFSPEPKWKDYYGQYDQYNHIDYKDATPEQREKKKEENKRKSEAYRKHRKTFERHLFYVALPVGLAAIVVGSVLTVQAIGAGLIFGGIFTLIDGYCWYWTELQDWMRFSSLLVAFIIIIVIGYSKLGQKPEEK